MSRRKYFSLAKMPIRCVEMYTDFLPIPDLYQSILKEVTFLSKEEASVVMMGKTVNIPRQQAGYGDVNTYYRFTGNKVKAQPWTPTLVKIRDFIKEKMNFSPNFVLVNFYQTGQNYIGWHSDSEKDLCPKSPIYSISLGATRKFQFQHKVTGQLFETELPNNTLVVMKSPCQKVYKHRVPKQARVKEGRINLTFRQLNVDSSGKRVQRKEYFRKKIKQIHEKKEEKKEEYSFSTLEQHLTDSEWQKVLGDEFEKEYFKKLKKYLCQEEKEKETIYPPVPMIFSIYNSLPLSQVRVLILGQDPYKNPHEAIGRSFAVPKGMKIPSSLRNIFKEIKTEYPEFKIPKNGSLENWVQQGVFLLNTVLTLRRGESHSHKNRGWEQFTDQTIRLLSRQGGIVFLLWGRPAQKKASLIDKEKNKVLMCAHPSGLSAHRGFYGCDHFKKCNAYLISQGKKAIVW